jgi:hypothetical protein
MSSRMNVVTHAHAAINLLLKKEDAARLRLASVAGFYQ